MQYRLFFPMADDHGRTMLDYFGAPSLLDAAMMCPFELVYEGEIALEGDDVLDALHALWTRHNVGDNEDGNRPRAREIRSMCVGDVIVTDAGAWIVAPFGFTEIPADRLYVGIATLRVRAERPASAPADGGR